MKYLFIGGHNDGKRIELDDTPLPIVCLPKRNKARIDERFDTFETEHYEAFPFAADGGRFIVYALYGMSPYQALQALIERYPAHESPSP